MKGTFELNPKTKRAIVALSIIALLILLAGMVSCSVQLSQQDTTPPISGVTDTPKPDPWRLLQAGILLLYQPQLYVQQIQHHLHGGILF